MARIFTSRIRPSVRSRVVFINARFPEIWFSVKICLGGNLRDNLNQERADDDPIADRDLVNIAPLRWISIAHCAASSALPNSTRNASPNCFYFSAVKPGKDFPKQPAMFV